MLNFGIVAPFDFGQDLKASRCTSIRMHMNTHSLHLFNYDWRSALLKVRKWKKNINVYIYLHFKEFHTMYISLNSVDIYTNVLYLHSDLILPEDGYKWGDQTRFPSGFRFPSVPFGPGQRTVRCGFAASEVRGYQQVDRWSIGITSATKMQATKRSVKLPGHTTRAWVQFFKIQSNTEKT